MHTIAPDGVDEKVIPAELAQAGNHGHSLEIDSDLGRVGHEQRSVARLAQRAGDASQHHLRVKIGRAGGRGLAAPRAVPDPLDVVGHAVRQDEQGRGGRKQSAHDGLLLGRKGL
jgi:hypothetical protein